MRQNKTFYISSLIMVVLIVASIVTQNMKQNMIISTFKTYSWGSKGDTVKQIQTRLVRWGYMDGTADGVYGPKTWNAVRSFQKKNGLTADGVVGSATLEKLGINSNSNQAVQTSTGNFTENDVRILAAAIYGESRGEPYEGQVAVGAVILNRVDSPLFPNTIAGVVYQPGAFTAVDDGQINLVPDENALNAARDALNGWDPSEGSLYYWNPATATSRWIWSVPITKQIGKHVFGTK